MRGAFEMHRHAVALDNDLPELHAGADGDVELIDGTFFPLLGWIRQPVADDGEDGDETEDQQNAQKDDDVFENPHIWRILLKSALPC